MKLIIVGFGFMGQTHCGNLLKMPGTEVVGIVDPVAPLTRLQTVKGNLQTVSLSADDVSRIRHYTDLDTALCELQADAAVICLPTFLHESGTLAALNHKLHVFVEKPFSLTEDSCKKMLDTAENNGCLIAVGHVVRKVPEYSFLHECVTSGRLGALKFLQLRRLTGIPGWGNWSDHEMVNAVGGALFDLVSHDIDFTRYLLGECKNITVDQTLCREFNGNYIAAQLHYPGTLVSIEGGFVTPSAFPFYCGYRAFFEKGTITGDSNGVCHEYSLTGEKIAVDLKKQDPYFEEMADFVNAVSHNSSVVCSGSDAAKTVMYCNLIRKKISDGVEK
ncbi:MAG: Gfo/Idh/MocA family oxidoreductase [Lentisphaeria bacterium]|nr:Gfo/Idh/MocA family oxidoreductase [Lentisphaeria bacterium]